jgi:hypothetical protein
VATWVLSPSSAKKIVANVETNTVQNPARSLLLAASAALGSPVSGGDVASGAGEVDVKVDSEEGSVKEFRLVVTGLSLGRNIDSSASGGGRGGYPIPESDISYSFHYLECKPWLTMLAFDARDPVVN